MLLGMSGLFAATLFVPDPPNWVLFLRAVAEAGMIGGLADWFAVEALFRHPLGIPVPHTALLPNSKDRVARNVGDFVTAHFLVPDLVREKLQGMNAAAGLTDWLLHPGNARLISEKIAAILHSSVQDTGPSEPPAFFRDMLRSLLMRPRLEQFIRKQMDALMASDLRAELTDYALIAVRNLIDENRDNVTRVVQDRSRWWIASGADRRLSRALVDELIALINDLLDRDSGLRLEFDHALSGFASDPRQSKNITKTLQSIVLRLVDSPDFGAIVATFIRGLKRSLADDLESSSSHTVSFIEATLVSVAQKLADNPDELDAMNADLSDAAGAFVERISASASDFIATTIRSWDENEMVALFENQVGNDLQFIRMNGTLLGGLIGGILFFLSHLAQLPT